MSSGRHHYHLSTINYHLKLKIMARNVTYSVVPRINPREKNDPPKYYAQAQASGDVNIREMSERIQASCTVTKADVYAVLVSMEDVIIDALKSGEIVRLGDLGTFQIGVSGKGTLTEEEYDSSLIQKARINFRPGIALSGILTNLTYAKVPKKPVPAKKEEESNEGLEE
jgi:predicted histone-like DNA-binding protein